jgi:transposase
VRLLLTAGQRGDAPQAEALLAGLRPGAVGHVIADAGYDSDAIRRRVRRLRARCCIRPNPTRKRRKRYDRRRYRHRNVVERFFGRVKRCRRVATRYEKKAENFAGFIYLAAFVTAEE